MSGNIRGTASVSPRNTTGTLYKKQLAEKAAQEQAAENIETIKLQARLAGHSEGFEKGLEQGWSACIDALIEHGVLDTDPFAPADEIVAK